LRVQAESSVMVPVTLGTFPLVRALGPMLTVGPGARMREDQRPGHLVGTSPEVAVPHVGAVSGVAE